MQINMYGGSVASSVNGINLVAAQFNGNIYTSTNGGGMWRQTSAPTGKAWTSVASSADGSNLVAVAFYTAIYRSTNGGVTWRPTSAPALEWISVASSADGRILLASTYGDFLFLSTNSGATWTAASDPGYWGPVAASANGTILAAVDGGIIYISADSGASWSEATNAPAVPDSIALSADGSRMIATAGRRIYASADFGATWSAATNSPDQPWSSVACSTDGSKEVVVADGGSIYTSFNYGATWVSNDVPVGQWSSVASDGTGNALVAVGSLGIYGLPAFNLSITQSIASAVVTPGSDMILNLAVANLGPCNANSVTASESLPTSINFVSSIPAAVTNGGQLAFDLGAMTNGATATITIQAKAITVGSWSAAAVVSSTVLDRVSENNTSTISIGIYFPGAQSWTKTTDSNVSWVDMAMSADGSKLILANGGNGNYAPVYTSTNGGQTLTQTSAPLLPWLCVASSADGNTLVAGGLYTPIYISTNAGATWGETSSVYAWLRLVLSSDGSVIVGGTYSEGIQISTNSGATWRTSNPLGIWSCLAASADCVKLAAGTEGTMYTSTNLGATWVIATNWVSTNFPNILGAVASSADGNRLVATPSNNGGSSKGWIYTSTDSGNTWVAATNGPNLPWQAVASSADGMRLVAIPSYGQIYTSSDAGKTWIMTMSPISGWSSIASSSDGTKLAALGGGYLYVSAPPSLGISRTGANTIVQWPSPSWSYALEQNSDLSTTNWSRVSGTAVDDGTTRSLEVNSSSNQLYFRLKL